MSGPPLAAIFQVMPSTGALNVLALSPSTYRNGRPLNTLAGVCTVSADDMRTLEMLR